MPTAQRLPKDKAVYDVVQRWIDSCLVDDGSLFTPGTAIWTLDNFEGLKRAFTLKPDTSSDPFITKLGRQLQDAPDEVVQLTAEVLYVHLLIAMDIGGPAKRDTISTVLSPMRSPVDIPSELDDVLDHGLVKTGVAYKTYRPNQLWLFIDFGIKFKEQPVEEQRRLLEDPRAFKAFLYSIEHTAAFTQRNALLHFVHRDYFEDIVSREHKKLMRDAFRELISDSTDDVDEGLHQIRQELERRAGHPINLYDDEYRRDWDPARSKPWDLLAHFAQVFTSSEDFDENERDYKLALARELANVLDHLGEGDWYEKLCRAISRTNLVNYRVTGTLRSWLRENPQQGETAIRALIDDETELADRVDRFGELIGAGAAYRGARLSLASTILLGHLGTDAAPYRADAVAAYYRMLKVEPPGDDASEGAQFAAFLGLLDDVLAELARRDVHLRDRVDAQSVLWVVVHAPVDDLSADDRRTLKEWRGGELPADDAMSEASEDSWRVARLRQVATAWTDAGNRPFLDGEQRDRTQAAAVALLDQLDADTDLAAFATAVRESGDIVPQARQSAHLTFLQSIAKHADDPAHAAHVVHRAYRLHGDDEARDAALRDLVALTTNIGDASSPSAAMSPIAASAFWHMQDPVVPMLLVTVESVLKEWGWQEPFEDPIERYRQYCAAFDGLESDERLEALWAVRDIGRDAWSPGVDPTAVARCEVNGQLLRATEVSDDDRQVSRRNAAHVTGDLKLLGRWLQAAVEQAIGQHVRVLVSKVQPNLAGLSRADAFVAWRPHAGKELPPDVRVWITPEGVAVGIYPGYVGGSSDRCRVASELAQQHDTRDLQLIASTWSRSVRELDPGPVRTVDEDFVVGRWYPANAALGRSDLGDELVALVTRLRPLFDSWLGRFGGMPAPKAAEHADDPLATEVQRFLDERGYPNAKDRQTLEDRVEFARALTPDALTQFDVGTFRTIINTGRYGGTGPQSYINTTLSSASPEDLDRFTESVSYLLWSDDDVATRIDALLEDDRYRVRGLGEIIIMKLLAITHPDRWIPVYPLVGESGKQAMLRMLQLPEETRGTTGQQHVEANVRLRERLEPFFSGDPHGMRTFLYWYASQDLDVVDADVDLIGQAADELLVGREWLDELVAMLRDKRQIIFYGPPGTGKTYLAQRLARAIVGNDESRVRVVQFHPSYSYEDFFEGYRPEVSEDGTMVYRLQKGPLARMAAAAEDAPAAEHVLIIDEINRANLPKVFGELLYLLEYREEPTYTQYRPDEPFSLPDKLYFIGTMNTADRSIALIDAALRRRFHFVPFFPHEGEIAELLRRWLRANKREMLWVADLVTMVNGDLRADLGGPHLQIGPSYFMDDDLDDGRLERIWRYSVHPYIEEQLFGQDDRIAHYAFDAVRRRYEASEVAEPTLDA